VQAMLRKCNVIITTGEYPLISRNSPIGAKVRVIGIQGGIGVSGIGDIVDAARKGVKENSGHLLRPFIKQLLTHFNELKQWYSDCLKLFTESTNNNLAKRQAAYFAAIMVAGKLLEPVYKEVGIVLMRL
jgi:uncharacterized protein (DUF927 family)